MRLALISDLHANFFALQTLTEALSTLDCVLCLGDLVGYYCQVNEVIDFVRERNALCILGNHDAFLLHGCPPTVSEAVRFGIEYADRVIDADHRRWLASLPLVWGGLCDGVTVLAAHGSPWRPLTDYLYPDHPALEALQGFDYDVIAFGQTHRPVMRTAQRPWLLNPGSVGQARHTAAVATALQLDTETMQLSWIEQVYDPEPVIQLAKRHGAGEWIDKHLKVHSN